MNHRFAKLLSTVSNRWDRYKRPVKLSYQIPAIGLAYLYRRTLRRPLFVGVTGSLGKTQTKALIAAVLAQRGSIRFDPSTDNRTYDAAKNLLQTMPSHTACLQEIGLSGPGTMASPVRLFKPDIAVITNVRSDHSEDFSCRREHVLEKGWIIRNLPATGSAILNADEPDLDMLQGYTRAKIITYGLSQHADVRAVRVESRPPAPVNLVVAMDGEEHAVTSRLHGQFNAYAILAALAVGRAAGVAPAAAARAIAAIPPAPGRMQYTEHADGVRFLLDDFKASEGSLAAIVEYLRAFGPSAGRKFLVLGSITYQQGSLDESYRRIIDQVCPYADEILLVGSLVARLDGSWIPASVHRFATVKQCADHLLPRLNCADLVVLKGRNWEDHLRRIELNRRTRVGCWQMSCYRKSFCQDCIFMQQVLG
jgi:UDP-N-acetylmuramoyl-tripeptide--D-alanyl-D-alanine ligase